MTQTQKRAIASLGGTAAHAQGVAHEWTREEAAVAGRRGGRAAQAKKAQTREDAGDAQDDGRAKEG